MVTECKPICHMLNNKCTHTDIVGPVAQSVQRLTTGWTVRDRIPVRTRFSARPDRPWGPPTGSFPGLKCGRGVLLTTHHPSSATVMEEYSYTSTHPLGHTGSVTGSLYLTHTDTKRNTSCI